MKPKQFPYNAVPSGRSRNTELMSRSLAPQYDGLSFVLSRSLIFNGINDGNSNGSTSSSNGNQNKKAANINDLSKSTALFNLNDKPEPPKIRSIDAFVQSPKASVQSPRLNGIKEEDQNNISIGYC